MSATDDPIERMKQLLETLRPHTEHQALMSAINQALVDLVVLLDKKQTAVWQFEGPGPNGMPTKFVLRRLQ